MVLNEQFWKEGRKGAREEGREGGREVRKEGRMGKEGRNKTKEKREEVKGRMGPKVIC